MIPKAILPVLSLASSMLLAASVAAQNGPVLKNEADLGLASGVWISPSSDADGTIRGALRNEQDLVVFMLDGRLTVDRTSPLLRKGKLVGHLMPAQSSIVPQKKPLEIVVMGSWSEEANLRGEFDALALSNLGNPFMPQIVVAVLHGRFSLVSEAALPMSSADASVRGAQTRREREYAPRLIFSGSAKKAGERDLADFGQRDTGRGVIECPHGRDEHVQRAGNRAAGDLGTKGIQVSADDVGERKLASYAERDFGGPSIVGKKTGNRSARELDSKAPSISADHRGERKLADYGTRASGDVIVCFGEEYGIDGQKTGNRAARDLAPRQDKAKVGTFVARWTLSH